MQFFYWNLFFISIFLYFIWILTSLIITIVNYAFAHPKVVLFFAGSDAPLIKTRSISTTFRREIRDDIARPTEANVSFVQLTPKYAALDIKSLSEVDVNYRSIIRRLINFRKCVLLLKNWFIAISLSLFFFLPLLLSIYLPYTHNMIFGKKHIWSALNELYASLCNKELFLGSLSYAHLVVAREGSRLDIMPYINEVY